MAAGGHAGKKMLPSCFHVFTSSTAAYPPPSWVVFLFCSHHHLVLLRSLLSSLLQLNNLPVQFLCHFGTLAPLVWTQCLGRYNLPCGDSSSKTSWWDSTSHSVFSPPPRHIHAVFHPAPSPFTHWSLILPGASADWMWPFAQLWTVSKAH